MQKILIFTDGAAKGNPGPGGYGGVILNEEEVQEFGSGKNPTTNNEMELQAALEALTIVKKEGVPVSLYSDSKYVVDGATGWIFSWVKNGWKTKAGSDVLHKEKWQALLSLLKEIEVEWHKVPGHVDMIGNECADRIASGFAEGKEVELYKGSKSEYPHNIEDVSYDEEKAKKRKEMRKRQGQKAFSYVSKVDGKIEVHKVWADCENRVKGKSGVKFKKSLSPSDEKSIVESFK